MGDNNRVSAVGTTHNSGEKPRTNASDYMQLIHAAHIQLLAREGVVDSASALALLRAIDGATSDDFLESGPWGMIDSLEQRVEAAVPPAISGAASLGRTRSETIGTALRMHWRTRAAELASGAAALRMALIELASAHAVTVMGGFVDHKLAAPTTLAHFLGGAIGGLETAHRRLAAGIAAIDRSPFGSGLAVGEAFGMDREAAAAMLGFASVIENTLDAAGDVEDAVLLAESVAVQAAVIRRLVSELLIWIRTDPTSFFIDERWEAVIEPAHPGHNVSYRLELLALSAQQVEQYAAAAVVMLRSLPYGPVSVAWEAVSPAMDQVLNGGAEVTSDAIAAVREALIVNRAYLANRAGRMYSTASDIAVFLMEDQQLNPAAAQKIAGLAVARMKEASLEAAQITPDIIDAAAVLVIGQELKVEMETLGRYIAPRRFIERRDVLGSPKSDRTRTWLANASASVERDIAEISTSRSRWEAAHAQLRQALAEGAEVSEN